MREGQVVGLTAAVGGISLLLGISACSIGPNPSGWGGPYASLGGGLLLLGAFLMVVAAIAGLAVGARNAFRKK